MLISVIIPVYNVAEWLPQCLDSVLDTDFDDYEIILVDDGSTDGKSGTICDEYAEMHPDLIKVIHQENGGPGASRNTGIEHAAGDYLLFVDSDDYIDSSIFEDLASYIEKYQSDIYLFGYCPVINDVVKEKVTANLPFDVQLSLDKNPEILLLEPSPWGKLWRRSLFVDNNITFPIKVWYEDLRASLKLFALADTIFNIDKAYYYYRIRENSIMNNTQLERNREIIDAIDDIFSFFEERGLKEKYYDELSFLALFHVLISASSRIIRKDLKNPLLKEFYNYTKTFAKGIKQNKYFNSMSQSRRLLFEMIDHKRYKLAAVCLVIKDKLDGVR